MALDVWTVTMTAAEPQGVPGEPPPGIWQLQFAGRDENDAIEGARATCPGWTVLKAEPYESPAPAEEASADV